MLAKNPFPLIQHAEVVQRQPPREEMMAILTLKSSASGYSGDQQRFSFGRLGLAPNPPASPHKHDNDRRLNVGKNEEFQPYGIRTVHDHLTTTSYAQPAALEVPMLHARGVGEIVPGEYYRLESSICVFCNVDSRIESGFHMSLSEVNLGTGPFAACERIIRAKRL